MFFTLKILLIIFQVQLLSNWKKKEILKRKKILEFHCNQGKVKAVEWKK